MVVVRVDRTHPTDVKASPSAEARADQFRYRAYDPVSLTTEAGIGQLIALLRSKWQDLVRLLLLVRSRVANNE